MNVIAIISCFLHGVVTLKLHKEYLYIVTYNTPILLWIKILNSLIYRTQFSVNIYRSYKLSKNSPVFLGHPVYYCSSDAHYLPSFVDKIWLLFRY